MAKPKSGSIRQRGDSYTITVDTGKIDSNGKRIRLNETVKGSRSEAERRRREILVDLDRGEVATTRDTLAAWLDTWMRTRVIPENKPTTAERYESIVRVHILPFIGKKKLADLRALDLDNFYATLRENGRRTGTLTVTHRVLKAALAWAVKRDELPRSPMDKDKLSPPRHKPKKTTIPSRLDVQDLLELAFEREHPLATAIHLAAYTGLRRGEIAGLRWESVNIGTRKLVVKESLAVVKGKGPTALTPKTDGSERTIDLSPSCVEKLKAHRAAQDAHMAFMGDSYTNNGIVFSNPTGGYFPGSLSDAVRALSRRLGLNLHFHLLRHFCASMLLVEAGEGFVKVSAHLGHKKVSTTMDIYGHVMPDTSDMGAAMDAAMGVGNMATNDDIREAFRHRA